MKRASETANQTSLAPLWRQLEREDESRGKLHADQLGKLGRALLLSGIHASSTAHRLARLIFHVTKNTGGTFTWTAERIAEDDAMRLANGAKISPRSVQRAAQQLRRAGIISQKPAAEPGRGLVHAARSIDWRNVAAIADGEQPATAYAIDRATARATVYATDRATAYANGGPLLSPLTINPRSLNNQGSRPAAVGPGGTDQGKISVAVDGVLDLAAELFRQADYRGDDGGIFYQAAAALANGVGKLTEAALYDAARGCRGRSYNAPAYFRQSLRNRFADADAWLNGVWLEPSLPGRPPWQLTPQARQAIALKPPPKVAAEDPEARRAEVLRQLATLED